MNIVLMSNTFTPHVGGVARSVEAFAKAYRDSGHRVLIIAPEFDKQPELEVDVIRVPAIQHFNGSDFSVVLPLPGSLSDSLEEFDPDIIHSQHPFLLGMTAFRLARIHSLPLVFTHHTLYEEYTHYVPGDSPMLKRFIIELGTRYANLANLVFAPSESIRDILRKRGVTTPIQVIPTGVCVEKFANGKGTRFRKGKNIPDNIFVVGHMGRLAPEKNMEILSRAVVDFLKSHDDAVFLLVGSGPSRKTIAEIFANAGMTSRLYLCGVLEKAELADALTAMNVFAFTSTSETQGMVLTEAMAAGLPVVAFDAPGVREVLQDKVNGRLLLEKSVPAFSAALDWVYQRSPDEIAAIITAARATADTFSISASAGQALLAYESLLPLPENRNYQEEEDPSWDQLRARIKAEWDIFKSVAHASDEALFTNPGSQTNQAP